MSARWRATPVADARRLRLLIMNRMYDGIVGGVEKMSIALANDMARRGHEVHIVSLDMDCASMYFPLEPSVRWHRIARVSASAKAGWDERFHRWKAIRAIMRDHNIDVAIGFQDGAYLSLVTAAPFLKTKIVAAERNSPARFDFLSRKSAKHVAFASFLFADAVTVQCPSYKSLYPTAIARKITVIPNPVKAATLLANSEGGDIEKTLLYVGRFDYQKNIDVLIRAFAKIAQEFPQWRLRLVGNGGREQALRDLTVSLNINDRVAFAPFTSDLGSEYASAQLFCLPSLWEGFPNVLAEAMAHGLPAVGFAGCAGVSDLIQDNVTGYLAKRNDDHATLAQSLAEAFSSDGRRVEMGKAAKDSMEAYAPKKVFGQWDDFFLSLSTRD